MRAGEGIGWRLIETLDASNEEVPVLLLRPNKLGPGFHIVQASSYEGYLYPDHLEDNVSWEDRIEDAIYWRGMLALPPMMDLSAGHTFITKRESR